MQAFAIDSRPILPGLRLLVSIPISPRPAKGRISSSVSSVNCAALIMMTLPGKRMWTGVSVSISGVIRLVLSLSL